MQINKAIYEFMAARCSTCADQELGGVLGCVKSGSIGFVEFENPNSKALWYTRVPNTDYINKVTEGWPSYFQFAGLFHIHRSNNNRLSVADRTYFEKIMSFMPPEITVLHFPLYVLPEKRFYGFKAERTEDGSIEITDEPITFI